MGNGAFFFLLLFRQGALEGDSSVEIKPRIMADRPRWDEQNKKE